jgi:hypothetical protein
MAEVLSQDDATSRARGGFAPRPQVLGGNGVNEPDALRGPTEDRPHGGERGRVDRQDGAAATAGGLA